MDDENKKKTKSSGFKVLACAGTILLVGNIGLTATSLSFAMKANKNSEDAKNYSAEIKSLGEETKSSNQELKELIELSANLGDTKEDDVRIASTYTIKATTQISDAYKSGDSSSLSDKDKETLKLASDVIKEIVKDGMTDYEKEKAVYEWMTKKLGHDENALLVIPTPSGEVDNPHGVLKNGNAVCVGYATTFRLFMEMLDIECKVVHNTEAYHSWDLVKLDDEWYHVDIYSDAGTGNYSHFNLNDTMMATQDWDREFFPIAKGMKYNYYYNSMVVVDDIYGIPAALRNAIDNKASGMLIKFKNTPTKSDMYTATEIVNTLSSCLMRYQAENSGNVDAPSCENGFFIGGKDGLGDTENTEISPEKIVADNVEKNNIEEMETTADTEVVIGAIDKEISEVPIENITASDTDAGMKSDVIMPVGISNNAWVEDSTDNSYIYFITFEIYNDEKTDILEELQGADIDRDKVNAELQKSFGDMFQDINLDMNMDEYY